MSQAPVIDNAEHGHRVTVAGRVVGLALPCADSRFDVEDRFAPASDGLIEWSRTFTFRGPEAATGTVSMDFATSYEPAYSMVPGVMYDGNQWGTGLEPKGFERDGQPWVFAWHRTAVAGGTYSEGDGLFVALSSRAPEVGNGFSCSLVSEPGRLVHRLIWPEEEGPAVYSSRDQYSAPFESTKEFQPGERASVTAFLLVGAYAAPRESWRTMLSAAWEMARPQERALTSPAAIWDLGLDFITESLWAEDGHFAGFSIGLQWSEGQWRQVRHYEIGWCGQNASLANSMLVDHLRSGRQTSLERGLRVLDGWLAGGSLPNGLPRCHYDHALFKDAEHEVQDACNLGAAALNYFEAEELAERCGAARPSYGEAALRICDFALSVQGRDGLIGKSWTNDGRSADPDGTIGAFLIPPLLVAYERTGERRYLDGAERGYAYYFRELRDRGYTTAGALDTYCVDKESAIPLLKAGLALFRATGNEEYLTQARSAAWYLASWQWHHSVAFEPGSPLAEMEYDTFGGTAVSAQHHHIDAYALSFIEDWLELADLTEDVTWEERARAVWANASVGISDGTTSVLGKTRPRGGQDEAFFHTRWREQGSVSEWLVAWPTAFRLEVLRRVDPVRLEPPQDRRPAQGLPLVSRPVHPGGH